MIKLLTIPLLIFSLTSYAAESDEINYAITDNISSEYVSCAAYFALVSNAVDKPNDHKLAKKYKERYEASIRIALTLAKNIRKESVATKVTFSRYENYLSSMADDIDNDFSNISILFSEHSKTCKDALEKPEDFIKTITARTASKYKNKER